MKTMWRVALAAACLIAWAHALRAQPEYTTWSAKQATSIGTGAYVRGRVGGLFDGRILKTERAYNYKLAATWMTPSVIRASARLIQLAELSDQQTAPLKHEDGEVVLPADFTEAQLTVRIHDREGTVRWPAQVMRR